MTNKEWFKNIWLDDNTDWEDFDTYFANYKDKWFDEFRKFYEYLQENKEMIWCKQNLTDEQWRVVSWNMSFIHADLSK